MLHSTDPERLNDKGNPSKDAWITLVRQNRRDLVDRLRVGVDGEKMDQAWVINREGSIEKDD